MELLGLAKNNCDRTTTSLWGQSVSCLAGPLISVMIDILIRLICTIEALTYVLFVHWKYPFSSTNLVKGPSFSFALKVYPKDACLWQLPSVHEWTLQFCIVAFAFLVKDVHRFKDDNVK